MTRILRKHGYEDAPDYLIQELVSDAMGPVDVLIDELTGNSAWDNLSLTDKSRAILEWNKSRKASERQGYPW